MSVGVEDFIWLLCFGRGERESVCERRREMVGEREMVRCVVLVFGRFRRSL